MNIVRMLIAAAAVLAVSVSQSYAATITVTSTNDSGPGSLRDALASAADSDTIDASGVSGTIVLTSGGLPVTNSLDIIGPGPANLAVNGNFPNVTNRVFYIGPGKTVVISGLTITNGAAETNPFPGFSGGGIYNDHAALTVSNCTISGNSGTGGFGGGIYNAAADAGSASLTIVNSTLSGNTAPSGGAIYNDGARAGNATITILNSTLDRNSASFSAGGIYNGGGSGHASVAIVNSTLSSNSAVFYGGGLYNDGSNFSQATAEIVNSTLSGNWATSTGGGIYNDAYLGNTSLTILNSTFNGNSGYLGGAIYNNPVEGNATFEVGSTILNAGASGANFGFENQIATVTSLGHNLCSDDGRGFLTATGDQINTDPLLGPLQDNGGPTLTHKPLACSPAIDQGKNFSGAATDQRGNGYVRTFDNPDIPNPPGGDGTDIGAYEVQMDLTNHPPIVRCKGVTIAAGTNCTADVSIDDGSYDPDDGDAIVLVQTPPGPYPIGQTTVILTATDRCGASAACTALVTVVDLTPPTIACPSVILVDATFSAGASVTFSTLSVTDTCSTVASILCTPASGSLLGIGDHPVMCTAVDDAGNTNSCNFIVHVEGAPEQLVDLDNSLQDTDLDIHSRRSLSGFLSGAGRSLTKNHTASACQRLTSFIRTVNRDAAKHRSPLPADQAAQLVSAATRIKTVLSCPSRK